MGHGQVCLESGDRIQCMPGWGIGGFRGGFQGELRGVRGQVGAGRGGRRGGPWGCLERSRLWGEERWEMRLHR